MSDKPARRTIKDGPFCWQAKEALRRISDHFAESNKVPSARSIYLAFCELASNEQSETFTAKVATVAKFAGVSYRTASDILPELEFIQVLRVERQPIAGSKMKAPSTYMLLALGNDCTTMGNNSLSIGNGPKQSSVAENLKNLEKNLTEESGEKKNNPEPAASGKVTFPAPLIDEIYLAYPKKKKPLVAKKSIAKALAILAKRGTPDPAAWLKNRVSQYAKSREGEDPQFTPHPGSWFNAGSYDEDFTTPTPTTPRRAYNGNTGTANAGNTSDYSRVGKIKDYLAPSIPDLE